MRIVGWEEEQQLRIGAWIRMRRWVWEEKEELVKFQQDFECSTVQVFTMDEIPEPSQLPDIKRSGCPRTTGEVLRKDSKHKVPTDDCRRNWLVLGLRSKVTVGETNQQLPNP